MGGWPSCAYDAIPIADAEGRILNAKPAFETLTSYRLAEVMGQKLHILEFASKSVHRPACLLQEKTV